MGQRLQEWAGSRGYAVAWGPLTELEGARTEVEARHVSGEIQEQFWSDELRPVVEERGPTAGPTVILVAVPRPAHEVVFDTGDGQVTALLPPTYLRYRATFEDLRQDLAANALGGARVEHLAGPVKNLAARLGLASYGRNNLAYVPGFGSFVQLCAYSTDAVLPAPGSTGAPALMPECESCGACVAACPTGAIDPHRVLLRAERCLTFANENPGDWPAWLDAGAHHCLLGCLRCQEICPVNAQLQVQPTGLSFSAEETRSLLVSAAAGDGARVEAGVRLKLAWLGQPYAEPVLGRNLQALIGARVAAAARRAGLE